MSTLKREKRWLRSKEVCEMLDISRPGLTQLVKNDTSFPRPVTWDSTAKNAEHKYVKAEVEAWVEMRMAARQQ